MTDPSDIYGRRRIRKCQKKESPHKCEPFLIAHEYWRVRMVASSAVKNIHHAMKAMTNHGPKIWRQHKIRPPSIKIYHRNMVTPISWVYYFGIKRKLPSFS